MNDLKNIRAAAAQSINRLTDKSKGFSRGFTLVELLVVVGMIALITGAVSASVSSAMQRARIQKATSEVKSLTKAILAYENYDEGLDEISAWSVADFRNTLKFLNGKKSGDIPVLVQAALSKDGVMRDPWGKPYYVKIRKGSVSVPLKDMNLKTGYFLQNFYRLTDEERK